MESKLQCSLSELVEQFEQKKISFEELQEFCGTFFIDDSETEEVIMI